MKLKESEQIRRFWAKVDKTSACWLWRGGKSRTTSGFYGKHKIRDRMTFVHRIAYELIIGPIPTGLVLDHLCRNTLCVNPDHLEPVTVRENILRGIGVTAQMAKRTRCKRGHRLEGYNLVLWGRGRQCRKCQTDKLQQWRAANRDYVNQQQRERYASR